MRFFDRQSTFSVAKGLRTSAAPAAPQAFAACAPSSASRRAALKGVRWPAALIFSLFAAVSLFATLCLAGCSQGTTAAEDADPASRAPKFDGLVFEDAMDLDYAELFDVYYYDGGYKAITIEDDPAIYLVVPEGARVPENLPEETRVLQQPLDQVYLCATSAIALVDAIGELDSITMTGTDKSGWEIEAPRNAFDAGKLAFAGKYSAPDYEMLVDNGVDMALQSTMILHTPEVMEMEEDLGIPVFIERSSYETNPLGRLEWIKLYGAMWNREDEADKYFNDKVDTIVSYADEPNTGKTVTFFSVGTDGSVVVRRAGDYIAQSIDLGGGVYAFNDLEDNGKGTTVNMTMEQFYATAVNSDYLVYNGAIVDAIESVDDLIEKSPTFADYKAVKEGNVWTTHKDMFQATDKIAEMISDFHELVHDCDEDKMVFFEKVS